MEKKFELNAIFKKEIIQEARDIKLPLTIFIFNIILSVVGIVLYSQAFKGENTGYASSYADMVDVYSTMLLIEYVIILFIVPVYSAVSISREYEKSTMELLLMTKTSLVKIMFGKLLAVISTIMILVVSSLPVLCIIFFAGGISIFDFCEYIFLVGVTTLFVGSIGMAISLLVKKTIISLGINYAVVLFLTVGTYLIISLIYSIVDKNNNSSYYAGETGAVYQKTDLGFLPSILMLNPFFSIAKLVNNQTSSNINFKNAIEGIGNQTFLINHWLTISVLIQLFASVIITYLCVIISRIRHSERN